MDTEETIRADTASTRCTGCGAPGHMSVVLLRSLYCLCVRLLPSVVLAALVSYVVRALLKSGSSAVRKEVHQHTIQPD